MSTVTPRGHASSGHSSAVIQAGRRAIRVDRHAHRAPLPFDAPAALVEPRESDRRHEAAQAAVDDHGGAFGRLPDRDDGLEPADGGQEHDREAVDDQLVGRAPVETEMADPARRDDVAVQLALAAVGMERQEPVGGADLEPGGPAGGVNLEQDGPLETAVADPALPASVARDRPRRATRSAARRRAASRVRLGEPGPRQPGVAAPDPLSERLRPARGDGFELAGQRRGDAAADAHVALAVLELNGSPLADASEQLAGRVRDAPMSMSTHSDARSAAISARSASMP